MRETKTPVERLVEAMELCAFARGEAQWINGYRAGRPQQEAEYYHREREWWGKVEREERNFRRLAAKLTREARAEGRGGRDA